VSLATLLPGRSLGSTGNAGPAALLTEVLSFMDSGALAATSESASGARLGFAPILCFALFFLAVSLTVICLLADIVAVRVRAALARDDKAWGLAERHSGGQGQTAADLQSPRASTARSRELPHMCEADAKLRGLPEICIAADASASPRPTLLASRPPAVGLRAAAEPKPLGEGKPDPAEACGDHSELRSASPRPSPPEPASGATEQLLVPVLRSLEAELSALRTEVLLSSATAMARQRGEQVLAPHWPPAGTRAKAQHGPASSEYTTSGLHGRATGGSVVPGLPVEMLGGGGVVPPLRGFPLAAATSRASSPASVTSSQRPPPALMGRSGGSSEAGSRQRPPPSPPLPPEQVARLVQQGFLRRV